MNSMEVPPIGEGFGGYFRKSKVVREGTAALSIETQDTRYVRWCGREGVTPDPRYIFKDNMSAWHGSTKRRDAFDKALAAMERGEIRGLWCPSIDRLSRGGAGVVMTLIDQGKRFYFDQENLDSANPQHRALIALFAEMAREKSDMLSVTVRHNKAQQRDAGAWLGRAPYGTRVVGEKQHRRLINDPETWPVVVRIFTERAAGTSERDVADRLTKDGIPAPGAGRVISGREVTPDWSHVTVHSIVHNPVYEGWMIVRAGTTNQKNIRYLDETGQPVRTFHPDAEVIPAELADKARLAVRPQYNADGRNGGRAKHMLTGLLRCVGCESRMPVNSRYHACGRTLRGQDCPNPVRVIREPLEHAVWDRMISRLINAPDGDPLIEALSERWEARQRPEETREVQEARRAVRVTEKRIQRVMEDRADGLYVGPAASQFQRHHGAALKAWEAASEHLASLTTGPVDHASAVLTAYLAPDADRRELIHMAAERITVHPDGTFRVQWVGEGDDG